MKFGLGTFGVICVATFIVADITARSDQNQLTATTYTGLNQKAMASSVANDFRIDAMRQAGSSNYSAQIS